MESREDEPYRPRPGDDVVEPLFGALAPGAPRAELRRARRRALLVASLLAALGVALAVAWLA